MQTYFGLDARVFDVNWLTCHDQQKLVKQSSWQMFELVQYYFEMQIQLQNIFTRGQKGELNPF